MPLPFGHYMSEFPKSLFRESRYIYWLHIFQRIVTLRLFPTFVYMCSESELARSLPLFAPIKIQLFLERPSVFTSFRTVEKTARIRLQSYNWWQRNPLCFPLALVPRAPGEVCGTQLSITSITTGTHTIYTQRQKSREREKSRERKA